jgi:transposase
LGIDEISLTTGQDSYCLVLSGLEQRCVIAVFADRRQETLEQWLDALSPRWKQALQGCFSDLLKPCLVSMLRFLHFSGLR